MQNWQKAKAGIFAVSYVGARPMTKVGTIGQFVRSKSSKNQNTHGQRRIQFEDL